MSGFLSYDLFIKKTSGGNNWFTAEGGFYETFVNDTGALSVKGTIVTASSLVDNAVSIAPPFSNMPLGVIYDDGVASGSMVKVVVYGKAQVLLKNGESATRGYISLVSDTAGRMYQRADYVDEAEHSRQIGQSIETKASGSNVLSLVQLHFN